MPGQMHICEKEKGAEVTQQEYFDSLPNQMIDELIQLNKGEQKAFCKKWGIRPVEFYNIMTVVRQALREGWTHHNKR